MDRQSEALSLAKDLLADVELSRTTAPKLVLKALRLARLLGDDEAQVWFEFEINGVANNPEGRAWMNRSGRWTDRSAGEGYWASAAALEASRTANKAALTAMQGGSIAGDMIIPAQRERLRSIAERAAEMAKMESVLASIAAQAHRFAARALFELQFSEIQSSLFEESRIRVDGRLAPMTGDLLKKIESINERLASGDAEAISQAMTTCRRLIDAAADALFPSRDERYVIGEQPLAVQAGNVQNRINAYVHSVGVEGSRADRIRRALGDLYGRVSTGVHSTVSEHEARFVFLSTYVLLGEIITLPERSSVANTDGPTSFSDLPE